jgi:hypothetical protein
VKCKQLGICLYCDQPPEVTYESAQVPWESFQASLGAHSRRALIRWFVEQAPQLPTVSTDEHTHWVHRLSAMRCHCLS